ncbi:ArsR/SmtB family transcription factor [Aeromicrobium terrae]|uniref:Helix-turn-helix transcriptional regulator n=1 Tax=Aeromicrobium terrae TaxID=2498846 RepID=A0A5C8NFC7_9ACTN|nr:helix-turn-helix domain-containing protein [Aeromicrobium terrae]TXL60594.1 helix-turn-helix transcriptional regulator [Aeromicrobium terrae]
MSTPRRSGSPEVRTVTEAVALSALAHPVRSRLIDALQVDGPSTASVLARRTDQAVGNVSHHLRVLAEAGLVEEAPELAKDRRERWWRLATAGFRWSHSDLVGDPAAEAAGAAAESLQLRRQVDRTSAWLDAAESNETWRDAAFATQSWLRLTPEELAELSQEIVALVRRWSEREVDDDLERESVIVYSRGFPSKP